MKTMMILSALIAVSVLPLNAQGKVGYADSQKILQSLKETETVQAKLQGEQERLYKQMQYLQDSLSTMQEDFTKNYKDNPLIKENIKQSVQKGMEELTYYIQGSQQRFQEELYKKQQELMQPILDKVKKALESVRKAQNLDLILDSAPGMVLAYDSKYDMTQKAIDELVKIATANPGSTGGKN